MNWQKIFKLWDTFLISIIIFLLWWANSSGNKEKALQVTNWIFISVLLLSIAIAIYAYLTKKSMNNLILPASLLIAIISIIFNLFSVIGTIFFYSLIGLIIYGIYKFSKWVRKNRR